jgi:hypothetical protein
MKGITPLIALIALVIFVPNASAIRRLDCKTNLLRCMYYPGATKERCQAFYDYAISHNGEWATPAARAYVKAPPGNNGGGLCLVD